VITNSQQKKNIWISAVLWRKKGIQQQNGGKMKKKNNCEVPNMFLTENLTFLRKITFEWLSNLHNLVSFKKDRQK
jgi:hypothetical protein